MGDTENPKTKLKVIKILEFLQAKQRAAATYQRERETSEENHLILEKLCEELWISSLHLPQMVVVISA